MIGYITVTAFCWKPALSNHFHYAAIIMWFLFSCCIANLSGTFQVSIFLFLQFVFIGGFVSEILHVHNALRDSGKYEILLFNEIE